MELVLIVSGLIGAAYIYSNLYPKKSIENNKSKERRYKKCRSCGLETQDEEMPDDKFVCPDCGGFDYELSLHLGEEIFIRETARGKQINPNLSSKKKVRVEFVEGDDYSHAKQKYVKKSRRIDRDKNEYTEKVTDPDTGEVIHDVKEDLNNHWGHGSAKEKKSKNGFSPAAKLAIGILVGLPLYSIYVGELSGSVSMMWILVVIILIFFGDR